MLFTLKSIGGRVNAAKEQTDWMCVDPYRYVYIYRMIITNAIDNLLIIPINNVRVMWFIGDDCDAPARYYCCSADALVCIVWECCIGESSLLTKHVQWHVNHMTSSKKEPMRAQSQCLAVHTPTQTLTYRAQLIRSFTRRTISKLSK